MLTSHLHPPTHDARSSAPAPDAPSHRTPHSRAQLDTCSLRRTSTWFARHATGLTDLGPMGFGHAVGESDYPTGQAGCPGAGRQESLHTEYVVSTSEMEDTTTPGTSSTLHADHCTRNTARGSQNAGRHRLLLRFRAMRTGGTTRVHGCVGVLCVTQETGCLERTLRPSWRRRSTPRSLVQLAVMMVGTVMMMNRSGRNEVMIWMLDLAWMNVMRDDNAERGAEQTLDALLANAEVLLQPSPLRSLSCAAPPSASRRRSSRRGAPRPAPG